MAPKIPPRLCKGSKKSDQANAAGLSGGRKARVRSQEDESYGQTRAKRPRLEPDAALPSNATPASSPDTGVALSPTSVATTSPGGSPAPDGLSSPDAPPSSTPLEAHATPPDIVPSPSPGCAVLPSTNTTAPPSPGAVAAAAPLGTSETEQVAGERAKKQAYTMMVQRRGDIEFAVGGKDAWDSLTRAIRQLARDHFVNVIDWDTLDAANKEKVTAWAPWAEKYLTCDYQPGTRRRYESRTIFEGWIWRILVDRVFKSHDGELWEGYGGLVTKLDGMAMLPPHLLTSQHAGSITFGVEGWQDRSSQVIKQLYYNWRPRTAELLQLVTGHRNRFDREYVAGLIREELGGFFREPEPDQQEEGEEEDEESVWGLDEVLADLVDAAVVADTCFQLSPVEWQILLADPVTGQTSGFPYQGADRCLTNRRDMIYPVDVHVDQSTDKKRAMGRPIHHIVRPLLRGYTLSHLTCTWDRLDYMLPMKVVIDMGWGEGHDDESEEGDDAEARPEDGLAPKGENETEKTRGRTASV